MTLERGHEETCRGRGHNRSQWRFGGWVMAWSWPSSFFQLPFPEITDSKGTRNTQASGHVFLLDNFTSSCYQNVSYRKQTPATAGTGPVSEESFWVQPQQSFWGKQICKANASFDRILSKKKKKLKCIYIFHHILMILIKSNEHFLLQVNIYLNSLSNWSYRMNAPNL